MNPFSDALDLHPRRSLQLALATLLLHVLAAILVAVESLRFPILLVLLLPVTASASWYWIRQRRGSPSELVRLICRADGTWRWEYADGSDDVGEVAVSSVYTTLFVLLHLRGRNKRRRSVALLRDSLDPDDFRRLRARLRLTAAAPDRKDGGLI